MKNKRNTYRIIFILSVAFIGIVLYILTFLFSENHQDDDLLTLENLQRRDLIAETIFWEDLDNNGEMEYLIIENDDKHEYGKLTLYFNEEPIYSYEEDMNIISVVSKEYRDLDNDNEKEIFVSFAPDANSAGMMEWFALKQDDDGWNLMEMHHNNNGMGLAAKPVIYLYPESVTEIEVELDYDGFLTCTYPKYKNSWKVTAQPDGTLTDENGQSYNYLYWEGISHMEYDFSKGFCIAGKDTATFLEEILAKLGLTRREANEFIVYWLPLMESNPYNLIAFQYDKYTENAKLNVSPLPDTVLRIFMAWKPLEEEIDIELQELTTTERKGFTVVEWGGTQLN